LGEISLETKINSVINKNNDLLCESNAYREMKATFEEFMF